MDDDMNWGEAKYQVGDRDVSSEEAAGSCWWDEKESDDDQDADIITTRRNNMQAKEKRRVDSLGMTGPSCLATYQERMHDLVAKARVTDASELRLFDT